MEDLDESHEHIYYNRLCHRGFRIGDVGGRNDHRRVVLLAQFVGVDLAKATILSNADSASANTSVAFIERIDLTAPGVGFTTTPPSGPLETTSQIHQPVSSVDRHPDRDQRQLLFGRGLQRRRPKT